VDILRDHPDTTWGTEGPTRGVEAELEDGHVLRFAALAFAISDAERQLLDPRWSDGRAKNISLRWPGGELKGAAGQAGDIALLKAMLVRYSEQSEAFALRLFPHYRGNLRRGNASFRPLQIVGRKTSWRKDDTRLHVDAFASNPTQGTRLLRVFCNVNPDGEPRRWRVGEAFEAHATRYLPSIVRPWPWSAWWLHKLGVTKRRRTEYDHVMLALHDRAKADSAFQRDAPQINVDFAPGTTWVVYSDQVLHAAMAGQYLLEQTFYLDVEHLQRPETSPLRTLERLLNRPLV
jgi:hypothetical protein